MWGGLGKPLWDGWYLSRDLDQVKEGATSVIKHIPGKDLFWRPPCILRKTWALREGILGFWVSLRFWLAIQLWEVKYFLCVFWFLQAGKRNIPMYLMGWCWDLNESLKFETHWLERRSPLVNVSSPLLQCWGCWEMDGQILISAHVFRGAAFT